jgi:hypothetical protein
MIFESDCAIEQTKTVRVSHDSLKSLAKVKYGEKEDNSFSASSSSIESLKSESQISQIQQPYDSKLEN